MAEIRAHSSSFGEIEDSLQGSSAPLSSFHPAALAPAQETKQITKSAITKAASRRQWTEPQALSLCKEIVAQNPFEEPERTEKRGARWAAVADKIKPIFVGEVAPDQRACRDKYMLLKQHFVRKRGFEERASGISCEETEMDNLLQGLIDLERGCEEQSKVVAGKKEKEAEEKLEKGLGIRKQAMERMESVSQKKKSRLEKVDYLKEKMEKDMEMRYKELELRKQHMDQQGTQLLMLQHVLFEQQSSINTISQQMLALQKDLKDQQQELRTMFLGIQENHFQILALLQPQKGQL